MQPIQLVVDSTAYLTKDMVHKWDVEVVPLKVTFEGQDADEGMPGEFAGFFERLKTSRDFPKTSQPSVMQFVDVFERALSKGKEVLAITLSSGVSGTYQSACMAADMVGSGVSVVDSQFGVSAVRFMVLNAMERIHAGFDLPSLAESLKKDIGRFRFNITVSTLDYLKKGGRINAAAAAVGNLLNIKPIIHVNNGMLTMMDKVRGFHKALETVVADIPETVKRISVVHISIPEMADQLMTRLRERFPNAEVAMDEIGPVVGAHIGPGALGVCFEDNEHA